MTEAHNAVFLSYASEDASAALRICDALRAAGIEVWFDQTELRGGDAWDASIRKQIRMCALFIPIISKNTHARGEGYFRLEWKLAIDRSHLMASNLPFLLPVSIDESSNSDERVPERFCELQWTRLPQGVTTADFVNRVFTLLCPEGGGDGAVGPGISRLQAAPPKAPPRSGRVKALWAVAGIFMGLSFVVMERCTHVEHAANATSAGNRPAVPSTIPEKSIAVLPFEDMSQAKDQEYLSDGLSEELISQLSRISDLRVPARTSSFYFKGKNADITTIAAKLRVAHLLEGSVRKSGNRLRVTAELIRAENGYHLWSQTYDIELKDVFKVQDEIARAVVSALKLKLATLQSDASQRTSNIEAYNEYLLARQFFSRGNAAGYRHAVDASLKAIAADPNYAAAYAGLALHQFSLADLTGDNKGKRQSLEAADKAIALAPDLAAGYSTRGYLRSNNQWDWAGANADFDKALALEPNNAEVQDNYGQLLQCLGRLQEAVAAAKKATELDPLSGPAWENLARFLTDNDDYVAARKAIVHALEISPEGEYALSALGTLELLEGNARDAVRTFGQIGFEGFRLPGVAMSQYTLGNLAQSEQALGTLIAKYADGGPYEIASVFAWRNEKDKAFEWLDRAYDQRDGGLSNLRSDPLFSSLRTDARYGAMLRRMNLAQ